MNLAWVVPAALSAAAALVVLTAAYGVFLMMSQTRVRVDEPAGPPPRTREERTFVLHRITEALGRPFSAMVLESLGETRRRSIARRIEAAGRPDGLTPDRYLRRKIGEIALYGSLGTLMFFVGNPLLGVIVLAFAGLTDLNLYVQAQERADRVQSQLPDFLDVLAVTVSAGLSFRAAVGRVAESMPGVLADEFTLALRQMELGTSRREAFEMLRRRNRNDSLSKFVTAIQQAEELGAPLSDTLVNISQDMRRADAQYMRRKAQRLNPRVTMITAVTLLPGLLLLIVGSMFLGTEVDLGTILGG
ncbi:type II secretion system F family protein [Nocardiopsis changdeensis]|uniref:Type II secretion system F family protein n=1 Tax=Nocardiopsis changdeensis TaxID=2831969 RepID=A0ABX8BH83_9ACTN|nr:MULTISPECIES: type II secretion system F family protein [Nocardiopsis]QUX21574.1 type II secretion system F family protein [Nocardiopsis changdeensis]QYX37509.1 type II secretion system F family protein [Nocardiopsis sp. MT53]